MISELENFFDSLEGLEQSFTLTKEIIDELETIQVMRKFEQDLNKSTLQKRSVPYFGSMVSVDKVSAKIAKRKHFKESGMKVCHI